jgi:hypothetical protein
MSGPCSICGQPREVAAIRWCYACVTRLHAIICSRPAGHPGSCDPPPGEWL